MKATAAASKMNRWMSVLALAAACTGAGAQTLGESSLVWIENESFGFEACAATAATPDAVAASMAVLRSRAAADLAEALRQGGVALGAQQFITLTPVDGALACGARDAQVTFRVAAVDRAAGKFWSADLAVRGDAAAPDRDAMATLADNLSRHFRGTVVSRASL
jgi:hypothetical protein